MPENYSQKTGPTDVDLVAAAGKMEKECLSKDRGAGPCLSGELRHRKLTTRREERGSGGNRVIMGGGGVKEKPFLTFTEKITM